MKKMIYFLALAASLSLSFMSCKDKKDDDDDDYEDMTLVISTPHLA